MLLLLIIVALALLVAGVVLGLGRGNWRRGSLRFLRRVRSFRRRAVQPGLRRLAKTISDAWSRPARSQVATQLRRLADRVERMAGESAKLLKIRNDLSLSLNRLRDVAVSSPTPSGPGIRRARPRGSSRDWFVAGLLALAGFGLVATNVWLLTEFVLPYLPDDLIAEQTMTIPVAASSMAFLLGLGYFALRSAGGFAGRTLGWAVWILVAMLAAVEGLSVVIALESSGLAAPTWWGGWATLVFLGLSGAMVPIVISALAHAAIERLETWISAREVRQERSALSQQHETANHIRMLLDRMEERVSAIRAELIALNSQGAGRLLMPGEGETVDRAALVLRRLSRTVESDPDTSWGDTGASTVAIVVGRDILVLAVWLVTVASILSIALPALGRVGPPDLLLSLALAAGVGMLTVMGAILRWILAEVPMEKTTAMRGALVLLTGVTASAVGFALGPVLSETAVLDATPSQASAWMVLLILVAAAASAGLVAGIRAAGALITAFLASIGWIILGGVNVLLIFLDTLLTGGRIRKRRDGDLRTG